MIERHDTVLPEYTDERLSQYATEGHGRAVYAYYMLAAPPEYRQGIAIRSFALMFRIVYREAQYGHVAEEIATGVGFDEAHQQALDELRAQGVPVHQVQAT